MKCFRWLAFSLFLLAYALIATAAGEDVSVLKSGAFYDGCINECTGNVESQGARDTCRQACDCMVDEINRQGLAKDFLNSTRPSEEMTAKVTEIANFCKERLNR